MPTKSILVIKYTDFGPGRVLLQFSRLPSPKLFNLDELSQQPGILEVAFSRTKKTLLISFNPKRVILTNFLSQLKKRDPRLKIVKEKGEPPQRVTPQNQADDLLSQIIWQICAEGNKAVKNKLNNRADLTSLIPVAFAALGLIEFVRRPIMPKWYDWWWFSYSIFRDLNVEKRKIPHFHSELSNEE